MCGELRRIRERLGVTFLHVTGSETEALAMGDQVIVLDEGHIAQVGPARPRSTRGPAMPGVARFLNCYNLIDGRVVAGAASRPRAQLCPVAPGGRGGRRRSTRSGRTSSRFGPRRRDAGGRAVACPRPSWPANIRGPPSRPSSSSPSGAVVTVEDHLSHREPQDVRTGPQPTASPGGPTTPCCWPAAPRSRA